MNFCDRLNPAIVAATSYPVAIGREHLMSAWRNGVATGKTGCCEVAPVQKMPSITRVAIAGSNPAALTPYELNHNTPDVRPMCGALSYAIERDDSTAIRGDTLPGHKPPAGDVARFLTLASTAPLTRL